MSKDQVIAPQTIKQSLTVAEQSAELDAGMAAQHYCRGLWGAARGRSDWRKVHEHFANGYKQGRYDEEMAQGPYPYPDHQPAQPDCRTCSGLIDKGDMFACMTWGKGMIACTNGDQYKQAPAVVLWRTE